MISIRNAPNLDLAESRGENLGLPMHKQIRPLKIVPIIFLLLPEVIIKSNSKMFTNSW